MRVIVRAFNKDGYYKDICKMDEQQVRVIAHGVDESCMEAVNSGLFGVSVGIVPKEFPEMVKFIISIEK